VTDTNEQVLASLRELAAKIGAHAAEIDALGEDEAARRALAALAEGGATNWTAKEVSCRALCALRAGLAYHSGMLEVMLVMQGLGSYAIARAGSEALRASTLPRVASGELVAAFALTEPDAGSDLARVATRAERSGANWRLRGHKTFISNAGIASFYTLVARTSGEPGDGGKGSLSMFFVPANARGVSVERFEVTAPHPIGDVMLDGVEVEDAQRIGEVGGGLDLALAVLGRFRTSVAAAANGFARRALDESIARLKSREQFGKPLASNQGLRFDVAEMDTRLRAAELLVDEAARLVDSGERATLQVARAKLFATENASWICDRAVQHFGGMGVKRGVPVERLLRDVRALRIYEGTSEVQKVILARELLG
jgi:alkylation response protein AidB-like acyl-CoA dehydrogenase